MAGKRYENGQAVVCNSDRNGITGKERYGTKIMKYSIDTHFTEYRRGSAPQDRREAVMRLLENPDSFEEKKKFYGQFADRSKEGEAKLWHNMDQSFEQYAPNLDAEAQRRMEIDIYASCELYGIIPEEYFQFRFYWKNDRGRNEYVGDEERFVLFRPCYDFDEYEKIRNKWLMYQQIGRFFDRKCLLMSGGGQNGHEEYESFRSFIEGKTEFVFKPLRSSCGEGIRRIEVPKGTDVEQLYRNLCVEGGGMVDEVIHQDKVLAKFHPQSANTVRLITLRDSQGRDHFVQSLFRMGQKGSFVDNNSGAIRARIDEENGYVFTRGFDAYGNEYILHPDSGEVIPGFQIPAWKDLLDLAGKVMDEISSYARFIGFDLAFTERGWTVVEINPFPQLVIQQIITGQGIRKEMLQLANECVL